VHIYTENTRVKMHAQSMCALNGHRLRIIHIHNTPCAHGDRVQIIHLRRFKRWCQARASWLLTTIRCVCGRVHIFACVQVCCTHISCACSHSCSCSCALCSKRLTRVHVCVRVRTRSCCKLNCTTLSERIYVYVYLFMSALLSVSVSVCICVSVSVNVSVHLLFCQQHSCFIMNIMSHPS